MATDPSAPGATPEPSQDAPRPVGSTYTTAASIRRDAERTDYASHFPDISSQAAFARLGTALALTAMATVAVGAFAIGRLSVRTLRVKKGSFRKLRIQELEIDRLTVRTNNLGIA